MLLARDPTVRAQTARSGSASPGCALVSLAGCSVEIPQSKRDAGKGAAVRSVLNNCLVSSRLRRRQNWYHRTSLGDRPPFVGREAAEREGGPRGAAFEWRAAPPGLPPSTTPSLRGRASARGSAAKRIQVRSAGSVFEGRF